VVEIVTMYWFVCTTVKKTAKIVFQLHNLFFDSILSRSDIQCLILVDDQYQHHDEGAKSVPKKVRACTSLRDALTAAADKIDERAQSSSIPGFRGRRRLS
jgi:hypothetical protein